MEAAVEERVKENVEKYWERPFVVNESIQRLRSVPAETIYPGHGRRTMGMETLKILSEG